MRRRRTLLHSLTLLTLALVALLAAREQTPPPGRWMAGDFHQHSYFTDGSFSLDTVLVKGFEYGLTWAANSEHGGVGWRDWKGDPWTKDVVQGDPNVTEREVEENGERVRREFATMWRWQSLSQFAWNIIRRVRHENPEKLAATGLEWNVPGHEHCSTGIVSADAMEIAEFEYRFDRADNDTSGGPEGRWTGKEFNQSEHAKAVKAVEWMQKNHPATGWIVFAHPERASSYTVADFRDFNDAGPDVAFGFEGLPGHQRAASRGGYQDRAVGKGTYGGAGFYIAEVGGLWDALLGEGRRWWTFVSSDFHSLNGDFWPGQYAKTWTWVEDKDRDGSYTLADIPGGLRSGNSFAVHGDLIDVLDFRAVGRKGEATMGETLEVRKGRGAEIRIRFHSPIRNGAGDVPRVRALQIIRGEVGDRAPKFLADGKTPNPAYENDRNGAAEVVELFLESDIRETGDGWYETPPFVIDRLDRDLYFRIRGTNLAPGTEYETDARGNPLPDRLVTQNLELSRTEAAWRDLWFYSNPVFVKLR